MNNETEILKQHLREYVTRNTKADRGAGKDKFVCPLCKSGASGQRGSDGAFTVYDESSSWYCFSCQQGGDLFDLIGLLEGKSNFNDQLERARELFGSITMTNKKSKSFIAKSEKALKASPGEVYLKKRGFTDDVIKKFRLGYTTNGIVIPYPDRDYYTIRYLEPVGKMKYSKPSAEEYGSEPLFLCGNMKKEPLFLCEGQFDAISLFQAGASCVAAMGGGGYTKLKDYAPKSIIYVKDNDEPGEKDAENVVTYCKSKGIPCVVVTPGNKKDVNELLQSDPALLSQIIETAKTTIRELNKPDNVSEYLKTAFNADVERFKNYHDLKTGFSNLDELQKFYPGLYVVGAISSLGKTTFTHQMGDQIAKTGKPVIIFSLEQNKLELVSKGLSRTTAQRGANDYQRLTAVEIREGKKNDYFYDALEEYTEAVKTEFIVECGLKTTIKDIEDYVTDYINTHEEKPVVIVDYLQIIQPTDPRQSTKESVDNHVRALKKLQSDNELVLIAISSLNRSNYLAPVDFESFKETGAIEYTADVVWGLQLQCLTGDEIFSKKEKLTEKRARISAAMVQTPREVELVCLKNRYGKSRYKCEFSYYPAYDYFVPWSEFHCMTESEEKDIKEFANSLGKTKTVI